MIDFPGASYDRWLTRDHSDCAPDWDDELDDESLEEFCALWETLPVPDPVEPAEVMVPCPACWESCGHKTYHSSTWDDPHVVEYGGPCDHCLGAGEVPGEPPEPDYLRDVDYDDINYLTALERMQ